MRKFLVVGVLICVALVVAIGVTAPVGSVVPLAPENCEYVPVSVSFIMPDVAQRLHFAEYPYWLKESERQRLEANRNEQLWRLVDKIEWQIVCGGGVDGY